MNDATFRSDAAHDRRAEDEELLWWPDGLPHWTWSFFMQGRYFRDSTAPLINLLNTAVRERLLNPYAFTAADVQRAKKDLNIGPADRTVRALLKEYEGYFWQVTDYTSTFMSEACQKRRGRPSQHWQLFPRDELLGNALHYFAKPRITEEVYESCRVPLTEDMLAKHLGDRNKARRLHQHILDFFPGVENDLKKAQEDVHKMVSAWDERLQNMTVLLLPKGWPLNTLRDCRAAVIHAKIKADPGIVWPYRRLTLEMGCSNDTVAPLLRSMPLQITHRFHFEEITDPTDIADQVDKLRWKCKGYPRYVHFLDDAAEDLVETPYNADESPEKIAEHLAQGKRVEIKFQLTSDIQVIDDSLPKPPEKRPDPEEEKSGFKGRGKKRYKHAGHDPDYILHGLFRTYQTALREGAEVRASYLDADEIIADFVKLKPRDHEV